MESIIFRTFLAFCLYIQGSRGNDLSKLPALIGHDMDTTAQSQCTFFGNMTVECDSGACSIVIPDHHHGHGLFFDSANLCEWYPLKAVNCSSSNRVLGSWLQNAGIIRSWEKSHEQPAGKVASCIFFKANWFECRGVANVTGVEPWRGTYTGNAIEGYRGNITNTATILHGCEDFRKSCTDGKPDGDHWG